MASYNLHVLCLRLELGVLDDGSVARGTTAFRKQQQRIRGLYEETLQVFATEENQTGASATAMAGLDADQAAELWQEYEQWERSLDEHEKANLIQWRAQRAGTSTAEASVENHEQFK